ncbi:MAG TPA: LuxR C-terminal-related transcriptional regulator, partial [Hyphomicrobiaceae bacterium]|nr:LuxR C-terminal-related transcriptional regulator [Hyphomicrobiaceae bacterium]
MIKGLERVRSLKPVYAVLDRAGRIVDASPSWHEDLGNGAAKASKPVIGAHYLDCCPFEPGHKLRTRLDNLLAGETSTLAHLYSHHAPDAMRWSMLLGIPRVHARAPKSAVSTLFHLDVTPLLTERLSQEEQRALLSIKGQIDMPPNELVVHVLGETLTGYFENIAPSPHSDYHWDQLSPREYEVAELVALGRSNGEIGEELGCSIHTIKRHVTS